MGSLSFSDKPLKVKKQATHIQPTGKKRQRFKAAFAADQVCFRPVERRLLIAWKFQ